MGDTGVLESGVQVGVRWSSALQWMAHSPILQPKRRREEGLRSEGHEEQAGFVCDLV